MSERHCVECGRRVVVLPDGAVLHRLPTPERPLTTVSAQRAYGAEVAFFTLATADHDARVINDYAMDPRD